MIRLAATQDIKQLLKIENEAFRNHRFTYNNFYNLINRAKGVFFVDYDYGHYNGGKEKIKGYAYLLYHSQSTYVRLYSIAVAKQYRGKRIGYNLLERMEKFVEIDKKGIILEVSARNAKAIKFYKKCGYEKFGVIKNYYAPGEDALRFRKDL